MAKQTNLNVAPYFDDYNPQKRFHQILFKAGQTVQARELTQLQDILNDQVESIGSHFFKNGSSVIKGDFTIKTKLNSVSYTAVSGTVPTVVDNNLPVTITGLTSGIQVRITKLVDIDTCFYEVMNSGNNGDTKTLVVGESIVFTQEVGGGTVEIAAAVVDSIGLGSFARVEKGIYYIRGMFVRVEEQEIILDANINPSTQVGFFITEEIITSNEDDTLNSNATGYPNYRASGADRLKITLTLDTLANEVDEPDFVRLALVDVGNIEDVSNQVQYSELEKVLAQRTYEESGNYSVTEFDFEIREHLNDGTNGGVYTEEEGGDTNLLVAVLEPGIHYVFGFRIENDTERLIEFPKSRETSIANNSVTPAIYRSLVSVVNCQGVPILNNNVLYNFRNSSNAVIGTMRVFSAVKVANNAYHLISRGIQFSGSNGWVNVSSITAVNGSSSFSCTPEVNGIIDSGSNSLIFNLPYSGVRTLQSTGVTDTNYSVASTFTTVLNSEGVAVISAPFGSQFLGSFNSFSTSLDDGSGSEIPVTYTLVGSPLGSGIQIDTGGSVVNVSVRCLLLSQKSTSNPRTKTLTTSVDTITVSNTTKIYNLTKVDVQSITSLRIDGVDYLETFRLDKNQTDYSYEISKVEAIGAIPSGQMVVEYQYFSHGEGDYFCVDSYLGVDYNDILPYVSSDGETYDLRDCIDFRRTITGSSVDVGSIAAPRSSIQADIEYYLARFISLYVDSSGDYDASIGVSAVSAEKPNTPENSMRLADLFVPSWTPSPDTVLSYPIDNKRFTMRDIGRIEKRVGNIEYTTSLNLLEVSASNIQVTDPITGGNRFKNGIFADPFLDFRLMDVDLSDASIDDSSGGRLRPLVETIGVVMEYASGGSVKDGMLSATINGVTLVTKQSFATKSINVNPHASFSWAGFISLSPNTDFWVDTVYTSPKIINRTVNLRDADAKEGIVYGSWNRMQNGRFTFGISQERTKTETEFTEWTTSRSAGENILKTQMIPFMRAITIAFSCSGLRPFTRVYPWFGNREVSSLCRGFGAQNNGVLGGALKTDSKGEITGQIVVPSNSGFSTGEKSFILTDNNQNPNEPLERTTYANTSFASGGKLVTKQRSTIQTRYLSLTQRQETEYRRVDPIAQSFVIETQGGIFCSGVDIFMKSKSSTIPLTVEIREMENGIPTHEVVARTVVEPNQVNISSGATLATRVSFAPSVYLKNSGEYCLVLLANTQEYQAYISEMGETVINSVKTVASQPHNGIFFTSANGSTWTPSQTQDLKFSLYRENYSTSLVYSYVRATLTDTSKLLNSNPIKSIVSSNILEITYPNHGAKVGDTITLSGVISDSGLTANQINKSHLVTEVLGFDTIRVAITGVAQASNQFGGYSVIASGGALINLVNINVNYTDFDKSKATFEFRYRLQNSRVLSPWIQFTPGTDILVPEEGSYRSTADIEVRVGFLSDGLLSPQVDIYGFTATLTSFRLSETEELFNYVSKPIALDNPSTSGRFFVGSLLPSGSNMKLYVRTEGTDLWVEINPVNPLANSSNEFSETEYDLGERDPFASFRIKVALTGSRVNPPVLRDIRGVVLA